MSQGDGAGPLAVLVVEDEQRVARVILTILERAGHRVAVAGSLHDARRLLAAGAFDVVVADFILPDGDGHAFAGRLQGERGMAAIVMSGLLDLPDAGPVVTLPKPFTPDQLERALAAARATARDLR